MAPGAALDETPEPRGQPLTFGGIAELARAPLRWLLLWQVLAALLAGASLSVLLLARWVPALEHAIDNLPPDSLIQNGRLSWPPGHPLGLVHSESLAIFANLADVADGEQSSDVVVELRERELRIYSVLGYVPVPYPTGWTIELNRTRLQPWWGAWRTALLPAVLAAALVVLIPIWWLLGAFYGGLAALWGWFLGRAGGWSRYWKLGTAAFLPGSVLLAGSILLYGLAQLNLAGLITAFAVHWVIGWVYLAGAPFLLGSSPASGSKAGSRADRVRGRNPFKSRDD